ncbi:MAG TPA: Crp/Fnr family transcriptional regulator [Blastocatellia bacterium]|nr:Crp/Fnr family transcriptional regulator [Blastocatellia bacterium]
MRSLTLLNGQSSFSEFNRSLCEKLKHRQSKFFGRSQIIYNIGDEAHGLYFLRGGLVKLNAISVMGKEIILDVRGQDETFGELCLCSRYREEMAVTMEPSEIIELNVDDLLAIAREHTEALRDFLKTFFTQMARSYNLIREVSFDTVPERLAKLLLRLADEFGQQTQTGTELAHFISQEELSQIVLARREIVSTALGKLRGRGLVNYTRKGRLTIQRGALKAYIENGSGQENDGSLFARKEYAATGD